MIQTLAKLWLCHYLMGFVNRKTNPLCFRGSQSLSLLQVTHQVSAPLSVLSTPMQCVRCPLLGTGVREGPCSWFSSPVSLWSGRIHSAVSVCHGVGPAVPLRLPLRVGRQGVVLLWTVARRSAVVAVAALSPGAAFRGRVAVLIQPGSPSPCPSLALQGSVQEGIIVSLAVRGAAGSIALPRVPPLLRQRWGAAAVPVVILVSVGTPGGAVIPLVGPVARLRPPASGAVGTGKVLQLV